MATWNSRGLRGSTLEDMINRTNEKYADNGLALIQKVPTPITPIKMDKEHRQITLAYFEQKSTAICGGNCERKCYVAVRLWGPWQNPFFDRFFLYMVKSGIWKRRGRYGSESLRSLWI